MMVLPKSSTIVFVSILASVALVQVYSYWHGMSLYLGSAYASIGVVVSKGDVGILTHCSTRPIGISAIVVRGHMTPMWIRNDLIVNVKMASNIDVTCCGFSLFFLARHGLVHEIVIVPLWYLQLLPLSLVVIRKRVHIRCPKNGPGINSPPVAPEKGKP